MQKNLLHSMSKMTPQLSWQPPMPDTFIDMAEVWDVAYRAGIEDERTSEANIGIAGFSMKVEPARQNPYKTMFAQYVPMPEPVTNCAGCPHEEYSHIYKRHCCIKAMHPYFAYDENKYGITESCPMWQQQNKEVK